MEPTTNSTCSPEPDLSRQSANPYDHDNVDTLTLTRGIEPESREDETPGRYWTSIWLRKPTLLALIALFTALAASLVVLLTVEQAHDGIRPSLSTNHYAWTYGPTAVLVVVLSLWRQVDYYCKLMQPWQEMYTGSKDAGNSLMLDYISPLMITSWIRAIRRGHTPVAASIAGFTIMKLIILFSTGLLVLTPTAVTRPQPMTFTTNFSTDEFWKTVPEGGIILANNEELATYSNISAGPVHAYIKVLEDEGRDYNTSLYNTVLQSLESQETAGLLSVTTEVDAFIPNISCEIARPTFRTYGDGSLAVRLDSSTCSVGAEHQTALELQESWELCHTDPCPPFSVRYNFWRANCSEVDNSSFSTMIDINTPYDFRFALLVGNYTTESSFSEEDNITLYRAVPHETAAVICKIDYSMSKATILQNPQKGSVQVNHLVPTGHLNNLNGVMLGEIMHDALWASQDLNLPDNLDSFDLKLEPQTTVPLYYVLLRTLDGEQSMDRFLSSEILQSSAYQVWAGIASQFVRESCTRATNVTATATVTFVESRLHVGLVSLWAMVVGFVLLIILTICIMFTTCNDIVPQDPGYLVMSSSTMVTSPTMTEVLSVCGELRTNQLSYLLSEFEFKIEFDHFFRIVGTTKRLGNLERNTGKRKTQKATAWIPLAAQYPMMGLTLLVPVVAIIILEILYQVSHRNNGLLDVYNTEKQATYLSRYISSSTVLLIATLFNSLDFVVASFAPYSLLRSGAVPSSRSLCFSLLGKLAPVALLNSIEVHHLSSVLSNSAGIIGSALTIVSSGLWMIDHAVVMDYPITASLADTWDVSWHNSSGSGDGGAGISFDAFQHGGTSLPSSSWHDIVFPSIVDMRMSPRGYTPGDQTRQNITIHLEGLRPRLDCEVVADEDLGINYEDSNMESTSVAISARLPLPPGCQHAGKNGTATYYELSPVYLLDPTRDIRWFGNFYDMHLGPWTASLQHDYGEDPENIYYQADNPAGCPSIGVVFTANHADKTSYDDVSALLCSQKIEKVKLNVTYWGYDMMHPSINTNIEPVVISEVAEYLTNGTRGVDSFPYRVQEYFQALSRFDIQDTDLEGVNPFDEFMNHLVYGPNGTAAADLAGKANRGRFAEAVNNLYARYMTFVIDQRFRQPISQDSTDKNNLVTGTAYRYTSRLKMNFASKLALQIMLATMTILGASAFWLTDLRGTLPRKPTTIASTLALFAGSDMCDEKKPLIPRHALWKHGKELDKVFDGWLFSLGWWSKTRRDVDSVSNETDEASGDTLLEAKEGEGRRFGIGVGVAEQLGFR
jgi:hypothetical protein